MEEENGNEHLDTKANSDTSNLVNKSNGSGKAKIVKTKKKTATYSSLGKRKVSHVSNQTQCSTITTVHHAKILPSVALSLYDKAAHLHLSDDQLICYSGIHPDNFNTNNALHDYYGGYRTVRATHGVHRGSYYFEVEILHPYLFLQKQGNIMDYYEDFCTNKDKYLDRIQNQDLDSDEEQIVGNVRVGWSTREGELQAPVGFDQHSFGYRDRKGSIVHKSVRVDTYGMQTEGANGGTDSSYTVGDVIGCFIYLCDTDANENQIRFYKNGVDQGIAFQGDVIAKNVYFPAISLYKNACVRVNFGPVFIKKYENIQNVNPISELQPMSPDDRKAHEKTILQIRKLRGEL